MNIHKACFNRQKIKQAKVIQYGDDGHKDYKGEGFIHISNFKTFFR